MDRIPSFASSSSATYNASGAPSAQSPPSASRSNPRHAAFAAPAPAAAPSGQLAPSSTAALPAPSAPMLAKGSQALSLKVMRISTPALHSVDRPYHEDDTHLASLPSADAWHSIPMDGLVPGERAELHSPAAATSDRLLPAFAQSLTAALRDDMLSNQASLLTLPASFGTLYLGEAFSAYLCVRNEARHAVRDPCLRVEMQVGDGGDGPGPNGRPSGSRSLLATVVADAAQGDPAELTNDAKLETTVRHEIRELGPHVLICTVSYKAPVQEPGGGVAWAETSFRKFYKFAVPASPLSVRTKTHEPRCASHALHPDHRVRERFLLEVQVQNISPSPLVFEGLDVRPEAEWEWHSIDRPHLSSSRPDGRGSGSDVGSLWRGINEPLLPDDVRQYLFQLVPKGDKPSRPLIPMPLAPALHLPAAAHSRPGGGAATSTPDRRSLVSLGDGRSPAAHRPNMTTSRPDAATAVQTTVLPEAIGSLDIAWRMSQGEPGRLQTSQLIRRRTVVQPVRCLAEASDRLATSLDKADLPSIPEAGAAAKETDGSDSTPTSASQTGLGTPFVPPSELPRSQLPPPDLPPPMIEVGLNLASAAAPSLAASAKRGQAVTLPLQLWVRDHAAFALTAASSTGQAGARGPSHLAAGPDSDDSDDDRPLSELASPRHGGQGLPSMSSRRSSAVSVPTAAQTASRPAARLESGSRTLFLAVQHLAHPLPEHEPPAESPHAAASGPRSGARPPSTRDGEDSALRSEPSSLLRSLTSPSTPSRPLVRRSLQQNIVANLASSPLLRTGSLSLRRGGSEGQDNDPAGGHAGRLESPHPPPTPPPKERPDPLDYGQAATEPGSAAQGAQGAKGASKVWPRPHIDVDHLLDGALPDVEGEDFERRGSTLQLLAPVRIDLKADGGDGVATGEASVAFDVDYVPLRSGVIRVGGMRVLVLGWQDEVMYRADRGEGEGEGGGEGGAEEGDGAKTQSGGRVELRKPVLVREWAVVAELSAR
ncbi:uncharacterized protein PFL1_06406 [Pseudozyma flocculosa PF-1]|uniref:Uncharacterized protein n=1 Tax=Pseudozyma flocculosa PF-1 TaxID=1277687 RepID=A0A061H5U0_9BASI|nr:uncharacterized protein PFL1_06406 [Pseudozyma flocculosa PF-1]EPQ25951.1 hypothetical protein PFL1_06406 [Pseudozyma flocculosa PF-1]